jgi:hypothetical protein
MSIELVLGGLFFFVVIAFLGGMFLLPELFGISKNEDPAASKSDEKIEK